MLAFARVVSEWCNRGKFDAAVKEAMRRTRTKQNVQVVTNEVMLNMKKNFSDVRVSDHDAFALIEYRKF